MKARLQGRSLALWPVDWPVLLAVAVAIGTGVGVCATFLSALDAVYFQTPGGIVKPDQLHRLVARNVGKYGRGEGRQYYTEFFSIPDLIALKKDDSSVAQVGGYDALGRRGIGSEGDSVDVAAASADFFAILGVRAAQGRLFGPDEGRFGDPRRLAVVSPRLWHRLFGSESLSANRSVLLDSLSYTVVGILDSAFTGLDMDPIDVWLPLAASRSAGSVSPPWYSVRGMWDVQLIVRVAASDSLESVVQQLANSYRLGNAAEQWFDLRSDIITAPLQKARGPVGLTQQDRLNLSFSLRLAGGVLSVLVLALTSATSLMLLRSIRRAPELAVRAALGMSPGRLALSVTIEALALAGASAVLALAIVGVTGGSLRALLMADIRWTLPAINGRILAAAVVLSVGCCVLPAIMTLAVGTQHDLASVFKGPAGYAVSWTTGVRSAVLTAQVALALAMLVTAGVLLSGAWTAGTIRLGFDAERLIQVRVGGRGLAPSEVDGLRERLVGLRDVIGVAVAVKDLRPDLPGVTVWTHDGDTLSGPEAPAFNYVDPGFLRVIGARSAAGTASVPLMSGEPQAAISATLASRLFRGGAVGRCLYMSALSGCIRIVAVVADIRWGTSDESRSQLMLPLRQAPTGLSVHSVLVRTGGPIQRDALAQVSSRLREVIGRGESSIQIQSVRERLARQTRPLVVATKLFSVFALIAVSTAAAGIYAMITYDLTARRREIAVRLALGASPTAIATLIIRRGLRIAAIGTALGLTASVGLVHVLSSVLFRVSPLVPVVVVAATALVMTVAAASTLLPALRAAQVDPAVACRVG
jgi:predicted permease